jgi:hypothetical protein
MAYTKISDVIIPEVYNPYFVQKTMEKAAFYMGGIITNDSQLNILASSGGTMVNLPFFKDLEGESEILSDSNPLSVNNITTSKDIARLHARGKAWGSNDLAAALAGKDPMAAIAELTSAYWARQYQKMLIASLSGVLADNTANFSGDMQFGTPSEDANTSGVFFDADMFISGQQTFGDAIGNVSGIALHSDTYYRLKRIDNISFEKESQGALEIERYRGLPLIIDDSLPKVAGATSGFKYTTYLFGNGAFAYGQGSGAIPTTETDRDTLQGTDILINRTNFILHARGIKWLEGSVAGTFPTNAELANVLNWSRVYERKAVKIAAIHHN